MTPDTVCCFLMSISLAHVDTAWTDCCTPDCCLLLLSHSHLGDPSHVLHTEYSAVVTVLWPGGPGKSEWHIRNIMTNHHNDKSP